MKLLRQLRALLRREKLDAEMAEEMRHHVELQAEVNRKAGMDPDEARYAALRQFGNVAVIQEQARDVRRWIWFEQLGQDVRYAFRQLGRSPGFTIVVVFTLALGIGATTAIYSVVNTVVLHPVGGPEPERLVQITQREVYMGREYRQGVCPPVMEALMGSHEFFSDVAWSEQASLDRRTEDFVSEEQGAYVSWNFFALVGAQPLLGRSFAPEDAVLVNEGIPVKDTPIVLSYSWWQSQWGGAPDVLGRVIEMSERHFTVVGVMPAHFQFPGPWIRFWIPAKPAAVPPLGARAPITTAIARLKPALTLQQGQVWLDMVSRRLMNYYPANTAYGGLWRMTSGGLTIIVRPLAEAMQDYGTWAQLRQTLLGLFAAISFVLLIVCANVANLTLARVERRQHELAIRLAAGASRGRLMRQLLTENLLLAFLGGMAGLVMTAWGLKVLMALSVMPRLRPVEIDTPLLGIALVVSTLTGIVVGLAPIWRSGHVQVNSLLADGGMNTIGGQNRSRYRSTLVVAQVAITIVLLTGAGLTFRSVNRVLQVNPGFDPQNLLLIDVRLPWDRYDAPGREKLNKAFITQMLERFRTLPGVKAVGVQHPTYYQSDQVAGRTAPFRALHTEVGVGADDVFRATRTPLLDGRSFTLEDVKQPQFVVVNETLAREFWPGEAAVGKKLELPGRENIEVIGVVGDARFRAYAEEVTPTIYHPFQAARSTPRIIGGMRPQFVIRTESDPAVIIPFVRRELKAAQPGLLMPEIKVARQVLFDSTLTQRTYRNYLGLFAGLGLLLSALGIYGVLAYSVARRTREIGIRIAIGAEAAQVRQMIMGQGARLILVGLASGLIASVGLTRFLQSQLYDVSPTDPLVLGTALLLLSIVALLACWLPARRAAKVDPVVALRAE
jgi:predicted permease